MKSLAILAFLLPMASSACEVNISVAPQVQTNWCWLATSSAILDKYEVCNEVDEYVLGRQCSLMRTSASIGDMPAHCASDCMPCNYGAGGLQPIHNLVEYLSKKSASTCDRGYQLKAHSKNAHLSRKKTSDKLCNDMPIIAGVSFGEKGPVPQHVVVLFKEDEEHYWVKDPWKAETWGVEDSWLPLGATLEEDGSYKMKKDVLEKVWHSSTWFTKVKR